jgi:endonuclease YncB( thermonuclease family)
LQVRYERITNIQDYLRSLGLDALRLREKSVIVIGIRKQTILLGLVTSFWGACYPSISSADSIRGEVVAVSDGDTITVLEPPSRQVKVRLMGIDAPEKKQPFGQKSKKNLSDLSFGRTVDVIWLKHDRYGRVVGQVFVDGKDTGLEQIKHGLAWHYKNYMKEQAPADRTKYTVAENAARKSNIGLWSDPSPIPPWEFRHDKKQKN